MYKSEPIYDLRRLGIEASSSAGQAGPKEMLWYQVIDHFCQTKAGIHRGLSSIHYASD